MQIENNTPTRCAGRQQSAATLRPVVRRSQEQASTAHASAAPSAPARRPARPETRSVPWRWPQRYRWQAIPPPRLSAWHRWRHLRCDRHSAAIRHELAQPVAVAVRGPRSGDFRQAATQRRIQKPTKRARHGARRRVFPTSADAGIACPLRAAPRCSDSAQRRPTVQARSVELFGARCGVALGTSSEGGLLGLGPPVPVSRRPSAELVEQITSDNERYFHHTA